MTYEEPETYTLHGVLFRGSTANYRRLFARMVRLAVFAEWHRLDTLVKMHHVCSDDPAVFERQQQIAQQLATDLAAADRALVLAATELIEQELGN